jgi:hypothetical protein
MVSATAKKALLEGVAINVNYHVIYSSITSVNVSDLKIIYLADNHHSPFLVCDKCTQTLLDTIDEIMFKFEESLEGINLHDLKAPWFKLHELSNITDQHQKRFDDLFEAVDSVDNFNDVGGDEVGISINIHNKSQN